MNYGQSEKRTPLLRPRMRRFGRQLIGILQRQSIAIVALCVALSGTAYAATQLKASSVGSVQVKNNSITSADIKNGSLLRADIRPGQIQASAGAGPQGPAGRAGAPGSAGAPGLPGPVGASGLTGPAGSDAAAGVVMFGTAQNVNGVADELFSWPAMGLSVRSDGDASSSDLGVAIRNTRSAGGAELDVIAGAGASGDLVLAGQDLQPTASTFVVIDSADRSRAVQVTCASQGAVVGVAARVYCWGVRSRPQ